MQTVLALFWHVIMAITGALGFALGIAAIMLCCGSAAVGCLWKWRGRKGGDADI